MKADATGGQGLLIELQLEAALIVDHWQCGLLEGFGTASLAATPYQCYRSRMLPLLFTSISAGCADST